MSEGQFDLVTVPKEGSETVYRYRYTQEFMLPGGDILELTINDLEFRGRGSVALDPILRLDEDYATFHLSMVAAINGVPQTTYSSCFYRELPLWEVGIDLLGGSVQLSERFLPSVNATGPVTLQRAVVELDGERQVVTDYWRLVYAAFRHNLDVEYWVILNQPIEIRAATRPVHAVSISGLDGVDFPQGSTQPVWPLQCSSVQVTYLDEEVHASRVGHPARLRQGRVGRRPPSIASCAATWTRTDR